MKKKKCIKFLFIPIDFFYKRNANLDSDSLSFTHALTREFLSTWAIKPLLVWPGAIKNLSSINTFKSLERKIQSGALNKRISTIDGPVVREKLDF